MSVLAHLQIGHVLNVLLYFSITIGLPAATPYRLQKFSQSSKRPMIDLHIFTATG
ncbi:hypothetical protein BYT27DRAFT_6510764 [Phlegmacium glaucopus]|nr:hypothetical protein BYT27DRAFT_6510764 [Phlegmacium glaucopus]